MNKERKTRKNPAIKEWIASLSKSIIQNDFRTREVYKNIFKDAFSFDSVHKFLIFAILEEQLKYCSVDSNEKKFTKNFSHIIDTLSIRLQVAKFSEAIMDIQASMSPDKIIAELNQPKWGKYLKKYKQEDNIEDFQEALRSGLLNHIYDETYKLLHYSYYQPDMKSVMTKYVLSLIEDILTPIIKFQELLSSEEGKTNKDIQKDIRENAQISLKKIAEAISAPSYVGRTPIVSKNENFLFWQIASVSFLYGYLWFLFKQGNEADKKVRSKLQEKYSPANIIPSETSKKVLCNHFNMSLATLNNLLSKKNTLY